MTHERDLCDECLDAVYDEAALDISFEEAVDLAVLLGADLPDHDCDFQGEGKGYAKSLCSCTGHGGN